MPEPKPKTLESSLAATIATAIRELTDAVDLERLGETWLREPSPAFRPVEGAPPAGDPVRP